MPNDQLRINERHEGLVLGIALKDRVPLLAGKAALPLKSLVKHGYIVQTLKPDEGFMGWKLTLKGLGLAASVRAKRGLV